MPIVKIEQINEDTKILIWHLSEDLSFFQDHLQNMYDEPVPWLDMLDKRKKEYLASRYLIQLGLPPGCKVSDMAKDINGSPGLRNPALFLGISHTHEYVSCVISSQRAGCDIEQYQERIMRLGHRFLSTEEADWCAAGDSLMRTHLIWGIKESAYKTWGRKRIDWKKHISIERIDWLSDHGTFFGTIGNDSGSINFHGGYEYFPGFLFVWSLQS